MSDFISQHLPNLQFDYYCANSDEEKESVIEGALATMIREQVPPEQFTAIVKGLKNDLVEPAFKRLANKALDHISTSKSMQESSSDGPQSTYQRVHALRSAINKL